MSTNSFSKEFFDFRNERMSGRKLQAAKGDVGGGKTPSKRTGVEALRSRDFLILDLRGPKGIGDLRLFDTIRGQMSVSPNHRAITIFL